MRFASVAAVANQFGVLQDAKMFRDGRLRHARVSCQRVDCLFAIGGEAFEDGSTGGVGQGFENVVRSNLHTKFITEWLWICQGTSF